MKKLHLIEYFKLCKSDDTLIYIYKWGKQSFYAIGKNDQIFIVKIPQNFNHLIIITRNVESFKRRLYENFPLEYVRVKIVNNGGGFIIPRRKLYYTPNELVDETNKGVVIKLYCQWAHILYEQIREKGEEFFFIEALNEYQSLSQCFINHFKIPSKGLFCIKSTGSLEFISDDIFKHFPFPFNLTSIEILNDIKAYKITTIGVHSFNHYENEKEIITNDEAQIYNYLSDPIKSGIVLTGWNESLSTLKTKINAYFPWKIIINASDCKEQFKLNSNDIFKLLFTQNGFLIAIQLLHMTKNNNFKITNVAIDYFYNFMMHCNVPIWRTTTATAAASSSSSSIMKIRGGCVFNPHVGIHKNISVVDFQSLYPNIIIRHGIVKGNVSRVSTTQYELNVTWYKKHFYTIINDDGKWWYLCLKNSQNPIQILFQDLITKRRLLENNNVLAKFIKLITNTIYGFYYLPQIPSLYDPLSASIITRYGRYYLRTAKQFIIKQFPGTTCLYGDTDSLFLSSPGSKIQDIVYFYNSKHYLKLSIEKEYQRLILIRKKQYIGKYGNNNYKFSGFPQKKVPPNLYNLMKSILIQTLERREEEEEEEGDNFIYLLIKTYLSSGNNNSSNHTAILYHLAGALNPLITTILKYPPLSSILSNSIQPIIKRYISMGYQVLDFSSSYQPSSNIKFKRIYFNKFQKFWESSSSSSLSLNIIFNEKYECATIVNTLKKSPRFYSLQSLEQSLIPIFEYDKYGYLLQHLQLICSFCYFSHSSSLKLFLQFVTGIKLNNEQKRRDGDFVSILRNINNNNKMIVVINDNEVEEL